MEIIWHEDDGYMKVLSRDGDTLELLRLSELEHIAAIEDRIARIRDPATFAIDHEAYLDDLEKLVASLKNSFDDEWVRAFVARHHRPVVVGKED